jgi:hypothetical protein
LDVPIPIIPNGTSAQVANSPIMGLRTVLALRGHKALTPYKYDKWAAMLHKHNLMQRYPTLAHSLQTGFDAGIHDITYTHAPPNSSSLDEYPEAYQEIEDNEFAKGRYLGPCSQQQIEDLVGPFQTSPLSLVPKPGKPGKFRAVHNFSSPHAPLLHTTSINSSIDISNFPCTWGTFHTIAFLITNLPPGSQASIRDVAEAY